MFDFIYMDDANEIILLDNAIGFNDFRGTALQIIQKLGQGSDHPVALNFPEGDYLKGLVCFKA